MSAGKPVKVDEEAATKAAALSVKKVPMINGMTIPEFMDKLDDDNALLILTEVISN